MMKLSITTWVTGLSLAFTSMNALATEVENKRYAMADVPDAIMCVLPNKSPEEEYVYHVTAVSSVIVRYDGPNGYLLHYSLPTGTLRTAHNPRPSTADCVSQGYTLQELIQKGRAFKSLSPMPSGRLLN